MSEPNEPTDGDRAFLAEMMSAEHMRKFHAEFMAAHGFPLHQVGEKRPVSVGSVAAGVLCEFTAARIRRERIIETARCIFEAISYEERGAGLAATFAASQAQTAFLCAEAFEDAADEYRKGVKP